MPHTSITTIVVYGWTLMFKLKDWLVYSITQTSSGSIQTTNVFEEQGVVGGPRGKTLLLVMVSVSFQHWIRGKTIFFKSHLSGTDAGFCLCLAQWIRVKIIAQYWRTISFHVSFCCFCSKFSKFSCLSLEISCSNLSTLFVTLMLSDDWYCFRNVFSRCLHCHLWFLGIIS